MGYGLGFDDPPSVPFAITQVTLHELKAQVEEAAREMEKAADLALRRIGNSARVVSSQAQTVIEAQSKAVQGRRDTILEIERESAIEYRTLLAELLPQQIGKLIEKGTNGIVQDVARQLNGKDGLLAGSVAEHARAGTGSKAVRGIRRCSGGDGGRRSQKDRCIDPPRRASHGVASDGNGRGLCGHDVQADGVLEQPPDSRRC